MAYIGLAGLLCVSIGFFMVFKPPTIQDIINGGVNGKVQAAGLVLTVIGWAAVIYAMPSN